MCTRNGGCAGRPILSIWQRPRQIVSSSLVASLLLVAGIVASSAAPAQNASTMAPLPVQEQGSFAIGGTIVTTPGTFDPIAQGAYNPAGADPKGQTLHGDHAYVFYQVPVNARRVPLVFWHGHGQSAKTWETTPDGREGFQTIFLRRGYPVYLVDQPRRGRAARSTQSVTVTGNARRAALVRNLPAGRVALTLPRACSSRVTPRLWTSSSGRWLRMRDRTMPR